MTPNSTPEQKKIAIIFEYNLFSESWKIRAIELAIN